MTYRIRMAETSDAERLRAIYAPYVTGTAVTFEIEPPDAAEFARRIERARGRQGFLVTERVGAGTSAIVGYASHSPFRARAAYQWSAEISIYLERGRTGEGLGSALLDALERLMAAQGIMNSEACITSDNTGSIRFHERHGYVRCATFTDCAYKLGSWRSIVWMEKMIGSHGAEPEDVRPVRPQVVAEALEQVNARLAQRRGDEKRSLQQRV